MAKSILEKLLGGDSTLGTNGERPETTRVVEGYGIESQLDESTLNVKDNTPTKYTDTAPEGQSGRI